MAVSIDQTDTFAARHIGPNDAEVRKMLEVVRAASLDELVDQTIPSTIRLPGPLDLPPPRSEHEVLALLDGIASKNDVWRSFLGMGYSDCITPPVIQRNILENPGWYTQYTPYQAEIAQGRLEALLNFQTMVSDLTGLPIANASLLDEATAAAEAMHLMFTSGFTSGSTSSASSRAPDAPAVFFVSDACHPQTIEVLRTRAGAHGIDVVAGDAASAFDGPRRPFGVLLQYPATDGALVDFRPLIARAHAAGAMVAMACDLLALALLVPPGELGADIAVGSAQRFGVPLGYGGPHAAFFACQTAHVRKLPGRIIGVSVDARGKPALRMALQTREQHIRREKATSNVCTAQALLAVVSSMYAVYHGPRGIRAIAERVHGLAATLATGLSRLGVPVTHARFFDTVRAAGEPADVEAWLAAARARKMNLRRLDARSLVIALDETTTAADVDALLAVFQRGSARATPSAELAREASPALGGFERTSAYLTHAVFNTHHSETQILRYMRALEARDVSLVHSMIPLGSCTMKLNATAEMMPITWPRFGRLHPFAPIEQAQGYRVVIDQLEAMLAEITGLSAVSLQPNSGAQGELAGLLVIRRYHESRGDKGRDVCLIPASAHGTNPASATMAGMRVVVVACDDKGYIDLADLEAKATEHATSLSAIMVTYPSTYGIFEEDIEAICAIVHARGGQVYLDGANLNAQVGLCRPGDFGADVCHVNLHKTFCIPHGGGGPGMGPIGVAAHLAKFLPRHPLAEVGGDEGIGPVSAAPWGSASILVISWAYIAMMGARGLKRASQLSILNANYVAERLHAHFPVFYRGKRGRVAHECILDTRGVKRTAGIDVDDIAKRLMDYGFHAPTMSFPIPGTLMVEPTESEDKAELDRFCDAMIAIRGEIRAVEEGRLPRDDNPLKHAPHTADTLAVAEWSHPYSREQAVFPAPWTRLRKFWPAVARINNAQGDRHLVCSCPPVEAYAAE
ncbi:MAG: aminomethyl-transferring glycine dehydrogenase [Polyangiaceae bacterium]|nr:aminomethyl-transferring glycine dehydrogenase [Polyangiaceae bacterium]